MRTVTIADVEAKLEEWRSGRVEASTIREWASARHLMDDWETESNAVKEVLGQLELMDMNLLTIEDIPALKRALRSDDFEAVLGEHFSTIDIAKRKAQLANDPMYAPFCGGSNDV
jgi:hypothetical protein